MLNRKSLSGESAFFAVTAVAICAVLVAAAAALLSPTPGVSAQSSAPVVAVGDASGYFPAQYVNQAKTVEPMPEMYY